MPCNFTGDARQTGAGGMPPEALFAEPSRAPRPAAKQARAESAVMFARRFAIFAIGCLFPGAGCDKLTVASSVASLLVAWPAR